MTAPAGDLEEALRQATGDELTRLVVEAKAGALAAALDNPALAEEQLLLLLRRPDLGPEILKRVSDEARWVGAYLVKAALVAHPHTPKVVALNLAKHLFWRDLAKLVSSVQALPAVRRMAEVLLRDRLHEITLGERVALARMAPREVIKALRSEHDERVMGALLDNPRFIEEDVLVIASDRKTPPGILDLLGRNERWVARHNLRAALCRNPRMPFRAVPALLAGLTDRELKGLVETPEVPSGVRSAARRLLAERRERSSGR